MYVECCQLLFTATVSGLTINDIVSQGKKVGAARCEYVFDVSKAERWYYSTFGALMKRRLADLLTFHSRDFHIIILRTVQSSYVGRDNTKFILSYTYV